MAPVIPLPPGDDDPQPRRPGGRQRRVPLRFLPGLVPAGASASVPRRLPESTLGQLVDAARAGNGAACQCLFVLLASFARSVASRLFGVRHDLVDDCVQESLRIIFCHIDHLEPSLNVVAYVRRVAWNEALRIRRRQRHPTEERCRQDPALLDESVVLSPDPSPLEAALRAEKIQLVRAKVALLPPECRAAVALKLRGASVGETAEILGIPSQGTVRSQLSRAYAMLRDDRQLAAAAA